MKSILIYVPEELHRMLKTQAAASGVSMASLVETGILLVLTEKGAVTSPEQAGALQCSNRAVLTYSKILKGQPW